MIVSKIHIGHFGKLSDFSLRFHEQVHIIEGGNEAGKSTIAAFLRFMLYGFDSEDSTDYERGISRISGTAEGVMEISVKGRAYRIERTCRIESKKPKVTFAEESRIIDVENGDVFENVSAGEMFLGIPRTIYSRVASMGQLSESGFSDKTMRQSIENLLLSGDEKVNLGRAGKLLAKRKDALLSPSGADGELYKLKKRRDTLLARREEAVAINRELLCSRAKLEDVRQKHKEAEEMLRKLNDLDICYRNVQLSLAFDKLHDAKQKSNAISERLLELKTENSRAGFAPDGEYVTEIGINSRLYADSLLACSDAKREWDEASKKEVIDEQTQHNLQRIIGDGGEEAVGSAAREKHQSTMRAVFLALLFGALALFCVAFAAWMIGPVFRKENSIWYVLGPVISFVALMVADAPLWSFFRKKAQLENAYYVSYGAQNRKEFRICLRQLAAERSRASEQIMRVLSAEQYYQKTLRDRESAKKLLCTTLSRSIEIPEEADLLALADEVEKNARAYLREVEELKEEKNRLDATASQLRDQLVGQNEKAVKNKITKVEKEQMADVDPEEIAAGINAQKRKLQLCLKNEKALNATIAQLEPKAQDPIRMTEYLREIEYDLQAAQAQYNAIKLALDTFLDVEDRLKARITPKLTSQAQTLVSAMTEGKYDDVDMQDDLTITLKQKGDGYGADLLSVGTRDLAYIALRLAMVEMVCHAEMPPLCLDECFVYQDDERALNIMKVLSKRAKDGTQMLFFTCRPREEILVHRTFGKAGYTRL